MSKLISYILVLLIGLLSLGFIIKSNIDKNDCEIDIQWIDQLKGDFDFRKEWSYPEGVYRNEFMQLDCDGICPNGVELMKDDEGKIYADSLAKFYQLVDTTHKYHSILCEAWCYEWAGADFIEVEQINRDLVICSTQTNIGTHSKLILEINNDTCIPRIELNSVSSPGLKKYYCKVGSIKIDKVFWLKDTLKAEFSFIFNNTDEPDREIFWKGKIYTKIKTTPCSI